MKPKHLLVGAVFAVATVVGTGASAATFLVNFVGSPSSFSSADTVDGSDLATSMTGASSGPNSTAISGIEATGNPNWIYANLFNGAGNLVVDKGGVPFTRGVTSIDWGHSPSSVGTGHYPPDYNPGNLGVTSAVAVSEPATWGMMLLGVGLMAGGLRMMREKRGGAATDESFYLV